MKKEWNLHRTKDWLYIVSEDFTYDVWLRIDGNFENQYEEKKYAEKLIEKLNRE